MKVQDSIGTADEVCQIEIRRGEHLHPPFFSVRQWFAAVVYSSTRRGRWTVLRSTERQVLPWFPTWGQRRRRNDLDELIKELQRDGWRVNEEAPADLLQLQRVPREAAQDAPATAAVAAHPSAPADLTTRVTAELSGAGSSTAGRTLNEPHDGLAAPAVAAPAAARQFRPDVEGLRAVAVALVVLYHAGVPGMAGGYIGVDVFFVLSGFLITGLLLRERESRGVTSIAGFYARRVRRILPASTLVLIVTILAAYHWLGFLRAGVIAEDGRWTALFAANFRLAIQGTQYLNATAPPSPLQHYWSLAVEEQFYLVWPLLFLTVAAVGPRTGLRLRLGVILTGIILASFAWSVIETPQSGVWAFFSPLTRAWELAIGALLAVGAPALRRLRGSPSRWLSWIGLAAVVAGAFVIHANTAFPGYVAALPVLGTAAVVAAGTPGIGGAEFVLRRAPLQWLGKLSYSLYLWHWPLLAIAAERAGKTLPLAENAGWVVLALVLSVLTFKLVENPIRYAGVLTRHRFASLSLGACLIVTSFAAGTLEIRMHVVHHRAGAAAITRQVWRPVPAL